jgi:hypothetical protein
MTSEPSVGLPPGEPALAEPAMAEPAPANLPPSESTSDLPRPADPRRRLRELRSIPERDRTDAEWDELNEVEIQLAPGNRLDTTDQARQPGGQGTPRPRPDGPRPDVKRPMGQRHHPRNQRPKPKPDRAQS